MNNTEKSLLILTLAIWTISFIQYIKLKKTQVEHEQEMIDKLVIVFNKGTNADEKARNIKKFILEHCNGRYTG